MGAKQPLIEASLVGQTPRAYTGRPRQGDSHPVWDELLQLPLEVCRTHSNRHGDV